MRAACKAAGVGAKSAQRLAYYILDMSEASARELAQSIINAKEKVRYCPICGNYTDREPCAICADEKRSGEVICVVEDPKEVFAMEKLREYRGRYHVLARGHIPYRWHRPRGHTHKGAYRARGCGRREGSYPCHNPDVKGEATASYMPAY